MQEAHLHDRDRAGARRRTGLPLRCGRNRPSRAIQSWIASPRAARVDRASMHGRRTRRTRADQRPFARSWTLDPYSTAVMFGGWKERGPILRLDTLPKAYLGLFGMRRRSLLSEATAPSSSQRFRRQTLGRKTTVGGGRGNHTVARSHRRW